MTMRAHGQHFLREGAIQEGDGSNETGGASPERGKLGCLRLHYERFWKIWVFIKLLKFKSDLFSNRLLFYNF